MACVIEERNSVSVTIPLIKNRCQSETSDLVVPTW